MSRVATATRGEYLVYPSASCGGGGLLGSREFAKCTPPELVSEPAPVLPQPSLLLPFAFPAARWKLDARWHVTLLQDCLAQSDVHGRLEAARARCPERTFRRLGRRRAAVRGTSMEIRVEFRNHACPGPSPPIVSEFRAQ